jgi:hypothetical protein
MLTVVTDSQVRELAARWAADKGALLDAWIDGSSVGEWQRAVDAILKLGWPFTYSEDGQTTPMPYEVERIFAHTAERSCLWQIRPVKKFRINCHFFGPDAIEFDVNPREIQDEAHLELLVKFLTSLGRALHRQVALGIEGSPRCPPDLIYEPETDKVTITPAG